MMTHNPKLNSQTEAEWEEKILNEALKNAVDEEGNVDFDQLRSSGITLSLEELYSDDNMSDIR